PRSHARYEDRGVSDECDRRAPLVPGEKPRRRQALPGGLCRGNAPTLDQPGQSAGDVGAAHAAEKCQGCGRNVPIRRAELLVSDARLAPGTKKYARDGRTEGARRKSRYEYREIPRRKHARRARQRRLLQEIQQVISCDPAFSTWRS